MKSDKDKDNNGAKPAEPKDPAEAQKVSNNVWVCVVAPILNRGKGCGRILIWH